MLVKMVTLTGGGGGTITELIPTMTSNTTPNTGECHLWARESASYDAFKAFDNNSTIQAGHSTHQGHNWFAYKFATAPKADFAIFIPSVNGTVYIDGSDDFVDWQSMGNFTTLSETQTVEAGKVYYFPLSTNKTWQTYRAYLSTSGTGAGCYYFQLFKVE